MTHHHDASILFDDFIPGESLGSCELEYDEALVQGWQRIFGRNQGRTGGKAEAASAAVILMMRAYLAVVSPRPPGNIQARQSIEYASLPQPGQSLLVALDCQSKEMKRGRRYVELLAQGSHSDGSPVFKGVLTLVWAA
ncbi:hypothetical protein [Pollutimonas harenae]|uniref:Acyl dehydratase n=1 Tax=Pollutimonas harenae TaxID=657015 RepID=A0A853GMC3_9BURK|nr:hypothetical protein [Pollutimonas harenae]NYT84148.1 hypothetical protein [Pollutimonas harenae]TEA73436.1 hypothetical protein ERD84_05895 [Pollutimonas harenae]